MKDSISLVETSPIYLLAIDPFMDQCLIVLSTLVNARYYDVSSFASPATMWTDAFKSVEAKDYVVHLYIGRPGMESA